MCKKYLSNVKYFTREMVKMNESLVFHNVVLYAFYKAIKKENVEGTMVHAAKVKEYIVNKNIKYAQEKVIALFEMGKEIILTEEKITYLKYEIELLQFYRNIEYAVKNMCDCAYLFADASEFQSAYRILHDANIYAVENKCFDAVILTLEVQGEVCIYEGDYDTALIDMGKALALLEEANKEIPRRLVANMALAKYRSRNYDEAEKDYERILSTCNKKDCEWWEVKFNKILCKFRKHKDINSISIELKELEEWLTLATYEGKIEYNLIAAEIFLELDEEKTVLYLYQAVNQIEQIVNENIRLHYRRGVREKYVNRIKRIISKIEKSSPLQVEFVTILVFLKTNMITEWLAIKAFINCTEILGEKEKERARNIIKRMEKEGIPVLYGFSEKYDDPFEEYGPFKERDTINKMWNDFAELLSRNNILVEILYKSVNSRSVAEYILQDRRGIYIFVESCAQGMVVWFNNGIMEEKVLWNIENLYNYIENYTAFQKKEASRGEFQKSIVENAEMLSKSFQSVISIIEKSDKIKVHFLTDYITNSFPFLSIFIDNENIKTMIDEDRFEFAINPILYVRDRGSEEIIKIDFVEYDEENLIFQDAEFGIISSKFQTTRCNFENWVGREKHEETVIHISSHGMPIGRYTDPVFANIRGEEHSISISIPDIQNIASKSNYNFVCINCCYGGEFLNRNFFKEFKTNELIGYSTVFMLNGKAAVIAPKWPVMDLVAVFFTELLYRNISKGLDFSKSYIKAIKELYNLDIENSRKVAMKISQDEIREKVLLMLERCPVSYPFKNIVDVGVYNFFELL